MNTLIEKKFSEGKNIWVVGSDIGIMVVSFTVPQRLLKKGLRNITIGEYESILAQELDSNIILSSPETSPFQYGIRVSSIHCCQQLDGSCIWDLVDFARQGERTENELIDEAYRLNKAWREKIYNEVKPIVISTLGYNGPIDDIKLSSKIGLYLSDMRWLLERMGEEDLIEFKKEFKEPGEIKDIKLAQTEQTERSGVTEV